MPTEIDEEAKQLEQPQAEVEHEAAAAAPGLDDALSSALSLAKATASEETKVPTQVVDKIDTTITDATKGTEITPETTLESMPDSEAIVTAEQVLESEPPVTVTEESVAPVTVATEESESITRMLIAATQGDTDAVRELICSGVPVDATDETGETALIRAARSGCEDVVLYLVKEAHATVDHVPEQGDGWTAAMFAAYYGRKTIVRLLIAAGASAELADKSGSTVLDIEPCIGASKDEITNAIEAGTIDRQHMVQRRRSVTIQQVSETLAGDNESPAPDTKHESNVDWSSVFQKAPEVEQHQRRACVAFLSFYKLQQLGRDPTVAERSECLLDVYKQVCNDMDKPECPIIVAKIAEHIESKDDSTEPVALDLSGNSDALRNSRLGDSEVNTLFQALSSIAGYSPFSSIDLSFNRITDYGAKTMATFLERTGVVQSVSVHANDIGSSGALAIAEALNTQPITSTLDLSYNPLGTEGGIAIANMLKTNCTLKSVNMSTCELGEDAIVAFAAAIAVNRTLLHLNLDRPKLVTRDGDTAVHLSRAFNPQSSLQSLSLSKHYLKDDNLEYLCKSMLQCPNLVSLDLSCNCISSVGLEALADVLCDAKCRIRHLNLGANPLTDEAAEILQRVISRNISLNHFDLTYCRLTDIGLEAVGHGLADSASISQVCLVGNTFGVRSNKAFRMLLQHPRCKLDQVELDFLPLLEM
jgi:Ran GTPase-activating protein (RanGAP) involved in mRNA processing and transport